MLSSIPHLKFLLDENVRAELYKFLKEKKIEFKLALKGASDSSLATQSIKQKLVLVTNDSDFSDYTKEDLYGVVLLKTPQGDKTILLNVFSKLINECRDYEGNMIVLRADDWESFPLKNED